MQIKLNSIIVGRSRKLASPQQNKRLIPPLIHWFFFIIFVLSVSPEEDISFIFFYLLIFLSVNSTIKVLFTGKKSKLLSILIVCYLVLKQLHLASLLNTFLIIALVFIFFFLF